MAYTTLKHAVEQQLAEIRSAGLYKTERQILSPQNTKIRVAQAKSSISARTTISAWPIIRMSNRRPKTASRHSATA